MEKKSEIELCPQDDIAAYVDGELSSQQSDDLERHLARCPSCRFSLREQRQFLAALSASLEAENTLDLPDDFTKKIVSNAESSVTGLRRPHERFTAIFISAALFLFAIFALGGETFAVASAMGSIGEQLWAVGSFLFKFAANIAFGVTVILRALASQFSASAVPILATACVAAVFLYFSSRWMLRRRSA